MIFLTFAVALYFRPEGVYFVLNLIPKFLTRFEPLAEPVESISTIFASAYFVSQGLLSLAIAFRPRDGVLHSIFFFCKAICTTGFVIAGLNQTQNFGFFLGAIFEGLVGVVLLVRLLKIPFNKRFP